VDPSVYLAALTSVATDVLGDDLVGVHPHGSLVLGGWRPERSDIDVLVVVTRPLTDPEQDALASAWRAIPCPAVGLELSVVLDSVAAHPVPRAAFELHVTTAPGDEKVVDGHGHPGDLDLVLHFAVCHSLGLPGFAPVPRALVLAQLAGEMDWAAERNPTEYAVLNACRALRYALDGSLVSKVDGGHWACGRVADNDRPLVEAALARQTGADPGAPLDPDAVRAFLAAARDVIRRGHPGDQGV
jgi:streptomycin 3"-adenylyltransferase